MKKKKKSFVEIFPSLDSYNFDKILSSSIFISFSSLKCSLFELLFFNRNSFTFTLLWKKNSQNFLSQISHSHSRNASKATLVGIVLRAIVFFFPFYASIAAFVPFPLFRGMSGSFGTWRDIKREGGRLFRSNKFRANCKILFTGSPMYILHIYRERARWELVWLEAWFWSENFEHFFQSCTRNVKLVVTNCTCNLDHTQMRRVNFKRILLEPLSLALPFFHPFAHKSYQVQVL